MSAFDGLVVLAQRFNEMESIVKELAENDPSYSGGLEDEDDVWICPFCSGAWGHDEVCLFFRAKALVEP